MIGKLFSERKGRKFEGGMRVEEASFVSAVGFDAVVEAGVVGEEVEADFAGGAVAVFGDVDAGQSQVAMMTNWMPYGWKGGASPSWTAWTRRLSWPHM